MSFYISIVKYSLCFVPKITKKFNYIDAPIGAAFAAFSLFFEAKSRRSEIALFLVPKWFETLWTMG